MSATLTRRWPIAVAACVVVAAVVTALLLVTSGPGPAPRAGGPATTTTTPLHRVVVAGGTAPAVPRATLLATLAGPVARYASPGGPVVGSVPGTWYGQPSVLPVVAQEHGYLEVRLAQRPNGSVAWISGSSVSLSSTPYRIVIDLGQTRLLLYRAGQLVMNAPAGIGTVQDPTPVGNFFVAFFAAAPSAAWGPFVMVTSGHSEAISDWEESGDAIVAIHGPLGAGAAIGTTGARVSHGCVRLQVPDLQMLRVVPAGTPVDIRA